MPAETALREYCRVNSIKVCDIRAAANVSDQAARCWINGTRRPSPENARALHAQLKIPLQVLRPDVYRDAPEDGRRAA